MNVYGLTPARVCSFYGCTDLAVPRLESTEKVGATAMLGVSPGFVGEGPACTVSASFLDGSCCVAEVTEVVNSQGSVIKLK